MTAEPLPRLQDPGTVDADNPWPGLASFREADSDLFFGRELDTQELLRLVLRERLTVLFGLSGLGKTSLLRAGLFPLLRHENVLPVHVRLDFSERCGSDLIGQVRQAILREAEADGIQAPPFPESETLWESLHRQDAELWNARNRIVTPLLVFDQFEEVFTLGRGNAARVRETEAFLSELADLCEGSVPASLRERLEADPAAALGFSITRHPYKVLLSLREDFLPDLEGLRGRIRSIVHNRFRLRRMNGDDALRVVTQEDGRLVEPDVPERVVRFVAGREDDGDVPLAGLEIEPALLSVVCRELNNQRRAQGLPRITSDLLSGNRDEILSKLYERSVEDLGPEVRSFIEERLLTKSGFRDTVALDNALELPGVTREALDKLTDRRLLRIDDRGGMERIELTHDVLTGVIRTSRDHRREREARKKAVAERREAERVIAFFALVLIGVVALASWGFGKQKQLREALASSDVERAWNLHESMPAHALAHLARALRQEPKNLRAQSLLTHLLLETTWLRPVAEYRGNKVIHLAKDGRRFVAELPDGTIQVHDTSTLQPIGKPIRPRGEISAGSIQLGGERILMNLYYTRSGTEAQVWDVQTGQEIGAPFQVRPNQDLSADGKWIAFSSDSGTVIVRGVDTGEAHEIRLPVRRFAFSPDGSRLLVHDDEQSVVVWDASTRREVSIRAPEAGMIVEWSPDGHQVEIAGSNHRLTWDVATGEVSEIIGSFEIVVVPRSRDEVQVWSLDDPDKARHTIPIGVRFSRPIELSRDRLLALVTAPDRVVLLNVAMGERMAEVLCACEAARFIPGTRTIATVDRDGVLRIWTFAFTQSGTWVPGKLETFSLDVSRLAVLIHERGEIRVLDTDSGQLAGTPIQMQESDFGILLSPDGRSLAMMGASEIRVWDVEGGHLSWPPLELAEDLPSPLEASLGPGGRILARWNRAGKAIDLWQLQTGRKTALLGGGAPFEFSPAGDRIAAYSGDGTVRIWSSPEGKPLGEALRHPRRVSAIDFSEDGQRLATAAQDGARIWDARSGTLLTGPLPFPDMQGVRFQPGGRLLAWSDDRVRVWETPTGSVHGAPIRVENRISFAQLSPDGHRILIDTHSSALLFDIQTGRQLRPAIRSAGHEVRLSPNGKLLWINSWAAIDVYAVPTFQPGEGDLLARWAEAVGGYTLDEESQIVALPDAGARLQALREETARAPEGALTAASLIRWFLADPEKRGSSPVLAAADR